MATSVSFSSLQLAEISRLRGVLGRAENATQPSGAVALYSYIFTCVTGVPVPQPFPGNFLEQISVSTSLASLPSDVRQSAVWLYGAMQVNSNNGAFSKVIREYNVRQGQLHGKGTFSESLLQRASNAVGLNLASSILDAALPGSGLPNSGRGRLPNVQEIGVNDLLGVRDTLFPGNQSIGSELYLNQAWPGIVMLGALDGQYTDRLLRYDDQSQTAALNSLADFKSLLFCWDSFKTAFKVTLDQVGSVVAMSDAFVSMNLPSSVISAASSAYSENGFSSFAQVIFSSLIQRQNADARAALNVIAKFDSNKILDMIAGTVQGKALIGTTTDGNFVANANAFFGVLTPTQLQNLGATLLSTDAPSIAALARTDVNARAALAAFSFISVQVNDAVRANLTRYDPISGIGEVTDAWIDDRSKALASYGLYWKSGHTDNVLGVNLAFGITLPFPKFDDTVISDASLGSSQTLTVDGVGSGIHYLTFGNQSADLLAGGGLSDRLYGGAGSDTLNGLGGNDYLEGNVGNDLLDGGQGDDTLVGGTGLDTYTFGAGWGLDAVRDSDGLGRLQVAGLTTPLDGMNTRKIADGSWQTLDNQVSYSLVKLTDARSDLYVSFADRKDVIRIEGWTAQNNVGITLPEVVTPPVVSETLVGDIAKLINGTTYTLSPTGYASGGALAGAADVLNGTSTSEALQGLEGNDGLSGGAGDDLLEGGSGDDLLLGGTGADTLNGGAGNDFIYGSAMGTVATPTRVDFTPPVVGNGAVQAASGFSWVAGRAAGTRWNAAGDTPTFLGVGIWGADAAPGYIGSNGLAYVETTGNVVDGGAGNDYIAAGMGADIVHGGEDDDDIYGMGGADVIYGDAGSDFIKGDGVAAAGLSNTTPDYFHGNDIISGGSGRDVLMGQGGDDELYGGAEDDRLWGDDTEAVDTPMAIHGNDYLDGGAGNDRLEGGGKNDDLIGGGGNDSLWGDGSSSNAMPASSEGADYLDGEDGNDQLAGGGGDDELFGGTGHDLLWGDSAYVSSNGAMVSTGVATQGRDYLDGEDGNDQLVGGGNDDTLFGGAGDDVLAGDDEISRLAASAHGNDYLDADVRSARRRFSCEIPR